MDEREIEKQKERKARAAAIIVILIAAGLVFCAVYADGLKRLATDPAFARDWIRARQPYGALVYCLASIVQIFVAVIPGEPLELAAGYAFGALPGTLLCLLAEGIGSVLVLTLVRRYGHRIARLFFSEEKLESLSFLHYSPKRLLLFAVIFIMPGTPKDLLCYFGGLTDIELAKLFIICSVGRIPAVVTSTLGGGAIGDERYVLAVAVFAVTAVLSVAGIAAYNVIRHRHDSR